MKIAETVTFGGGGLDRTAHLRSQPDRIAELQASAASRNICYWRGRLLFANPDATCLAILPADCSLLEQAGAGQVFLGMNETVPVFAWDISAWEPAATEDPETGFFDSREIRHPDLPDDHWFGDLRENMARLSPLDAELAATARALFCWHDIHGFCAKCGQKTEPEQAGWQRQCPDCKAHHFPRTDPVVIMLLTQGNNVLLGRAPGWPDTMYSLLAGFVEPGETLEAAARREVAEEVGVTVGRVSYLASQPWPFPASLMVSCHCQAQSTDITLDPQEIEHALWLSREQLMDVFAGQNPDIKPSRRGSIANFILQNWLADRLN